MSDYALLYEHLTLLGAEQWALQLPAPLEAALSIEAHGELAGWQQLIEQVPRVTPSRVDLSCDAVCIGDSLDLTDTQQQQLNVALQALHPWRKGPYDLFGIHIDTEWRSDWKWQRLAGHISSLEHRVVLDVGCGNGYHCWRMLGAGAKLVVGIDPTLLSVMQFNLIKKLHGAAPVYVLPLGIEALPYGMKLFDTVFSMGVFYHRRSPMDHLLELRGCLQPGGELVLETLVIEGKPGEVLVPEGRYAKMRNVWFIPTVATLISWMQRCGFKNCRVVDINQTSTEEQRSTDWMRFHSLKDFLDADDPNFTCEGLPAPRRGVFIANT
ncbi:MAG: tRNA 5-methoxyuridine(34)/uridine 5-oxyacetic acid(34) synthase CmoB [Methylococcales bacterium]